MRHGSLTLDDHPRLDFPIDVHSSAQGDSPVKVQSLPRETTMRVSMASVLALLSLLAAGVTARAAEYPNRPITLLLGFAPGGPSDVIARLVGKAMEQELKQPVVIDYRAGAGGAIAAQFVSHAEPDGYMLLLGTGAMLAINPALQKNLGYDPLTSFATISMIGTQTNVLNVTPSLPVTSLGELIAYAKAHRGKLNFASGGNGTPAHLAGELLKIDAKIEMTHVPYKGTGPGIQAVIAGEVQVAFSPAPPLVGHIQAGLVRPLAVTTLTRTAVLPEVPTIAEQGFPGFEATAWHGLVAPAGTPKPVIARLHQALVVALRDPGLLKQLSDLGIDLVGSSPAEFHAYLARDIPKWAAIAKAAGIAAER
jgi:tripartite-type tricarboxylate transporter receptor subunit TctC